MFLNQNNHFLLEGEETERLTFRKVDRMDFEEWLIFCTYPDSLKYIKITSSEDPIINCNAWFDKVFYRYENKLGGMNALIDKQTHKLVGQCGLLVQTVEGVQELEIGYSLMPEFRGQGFALEAALKCKEYAFQNNLAESLISLIDVDNIASQKVAVANGMQIEKEIDYNGMRMFVFRIKKL